MELLLANQPNMNIVYVAPCKIRFTKHTISHQFDSGKNLDRTYRELLYRETSPEAIKLMKVVKHDSNIWVVEGNRRLFVYQHMEELEVVSKVPVLLIKLKSGQFGRICRTYNHGLSVNISELPRLPRQYQLKDRMDIVEEGWERRGMPRRGFQAADLPPDFDDDDGPAGDPNYVNEDFEMNGHRHRCFVFDYFKCQKSYYHRRKLYPAYRI